MNFQDELFLNISHLIKFKNLPQDIYGIAMNLFHYYTYFKSFRDIDRAELTITCVILAHKIKHGYMRSEQIIDLYEYFPYKNDNNKKTSNNIPILNNSLKPNPNIADVEMDILIFLGYDLDIEMPFQYVAQYKKTFNIDKKLENFITNLINDSYRRPLCLYFHPKTIALVSIFIGLTFFNKDDVMLSINSFLKSEKQYIKDEYKLCFEHMYKLFDNKLVKNKD